MKIEKLRNNHKKEIIIGTILTVVIGGALTYKLTHSKYRTTQSIDLATGTINYTVPDFKIMAMYKNDGSGDVSIDSMPTSGYVINEEKTYCQTSSGSQVKGKIKTVNGIHGISGLNKGDKCYLYFDVKKTTIDDIIATIKASSSYKGTTTPDFSSIATGAETEANNGIYATTDGTNMYSGTTYYWRGAATTNHVIFANKCWRIVRINGDKTMRLIHNGAVQTGNTCVGNGLNSDAIIIGTTYEDRYYATSDGAYNNSSYVGWTYNLNNQRPINNLTATASYIKTQIEKWFDSNITGANINKVDIIGKFCNDRNVDVPPSIWGWGTNYTTTWGATGTRFTYAGAKRLYESYSPTFNCPTGDVYTLKVGLITADEVEFAGGKYENNDKYYLYVGNQYWTMSPSHWTTMVYVFIVGSNGKLDNHYVSATPGFRPVINLKADTTFSSGDGTQNSPYVVS